MIVLMVSLAFHADLASSAVAKNAKAMKSHVAYEATFTYLHNKKGAIQGDLIMDHGKRLFYEGTAPRIRYVMSITPNLYREIDYFTKQYDEFPYQGGYTVYPTRISPVQSSIPLWLRLPNLVRLLPSGTSFKFVGSRMIGSRRCDHIHSDIKTQVGRGTVDIDIADDGLVYKFNRVTYAPTGADEETWDFIHYRSFTSFADSRFGTTVPDGFVPYALAYHDGPTEIGAHVSLAGFVDSRTGRPAVLPTAKPILLLVAGHDSLPGRNAVAAIRTWNGAITQAGAATVLVSDATSAAEADGLLYDPTQKTMQLLAPPATPLFYLFDRTGKLANVWLGYDASDAAKLKSDVLKALSALQ